MLILKLYIYTKNIYFKYKYAYLIISIKNTTYFRRS